MRALTYILQVAAVLLIGGAAVLTAIAIIIGRYDLIPLFTLIAALNLYLFSTQKKIRERL